MLIEIYEAVLAALDVRKLVRAQLRGQPQRVLGLGKIAAEMCVPEIAQGALLVAPKDSPDVQGARVLRGSHPMPDESSLAAGAALLERAASAKEEVLLLISGGGSALAEAPRIDLQKLRQVNDLLLRSGATIEEMNCVRAHLSRLKGGGLARALFDAGVRRARALVAVDVPIGGTAAVASGPASADPTTCEDAQRLASKYALPPLEFSETLKPGEPADIVEHIALWDMRSPAIEASRRGFQLFEESPITGTPEELASKLAALPAGSYAASGELTIKVPRSAPPGGRDQHLALLVARAIRGESGAEFLACGTDGRDGPTEAAGAFVDQSTWERAVAKGLAPERALAEFDAGRVLTALGAIVPTRHTGTHAGDLFLIRK